MSWGNSGGQGNQGRPGEEGGGREWGRNPQPHRCEADKAESKIIFLFIAKYSNKGN